MAGRAAQNNQQGHSDTISMNGQGPSNLQLKSPLQQPIHHRPHVANGGGAMQNVQGRHDDKARPHLPPPMADASPSNPHFGMHPHQTAALRRSPSPQPSQAASAHGAGSAPHVPTQALAPAPADPRIKHKLAPTALAGAFVRPAVLSVQSSGPIAVDADKHSVHGHISAKSTGHDAPESRRTEDSGACGSNAACLPRLTNVTAATASAATAGLDRSRAMPAATAAPRQQLPAAASRPAAIPRPAGRPAAIPRPLTRSPTGGNDITHAAADMAVARPPAGSASSASVEANKSRPSDRQAASFAHGQRPLAEAGGLQDALAFSHETCQDVGHGQVSMHGASESSQSQPRQGVNIPDAAGWIRPPAASRNSFPQPSQHAPLAVRGGLALGPGPFPRQETPPGLQPAGLTIEPHLRTDALQAAARLVSCDNQHSAQGMDQQAGVLSSQAGGWIRPPGVPDPKGSLGQHASISGLTADHKAWPSGPGEGAQQPTRPSHFPERQPDHRSHEQAQGSGSHRPDQPTHAGSADMGPDHGEGSRSEHSGDLGPSYDSSHMSLRMGHCGQAGSSAAQQGQDQWGLQQGVRPRLPRRVPLPIPRPALHGPGRPAGQ